MKIIRSYRKFIFPIFILFFSNSSFAYPEFIGYGYTSCITCHFNGHGHGALSDYGRALWSSEISSRGFYPASWSNEDIATTSGFLGKKELPWWIRPAIKYRSLNNYNNPGSPTAANRTYLMQADLNTTFIFDKNLNYLLNINIGEVPQSEATRQGQSGRIILREYFFRAQPFESWWIYIGLMDKVFGIRNLDHTSYQRNPLGLTQYAQSEGIVVHKIAEKWELSANYFNGNSKVTNYNQEQKGFSIMGEYEPAEKLRFGGSMLSSQSNLDVRSAYSVHYKHGLTKGNSLMGEVGYLQTKVNATRAETTGNYIFLQSTYLMTRGYHLRTAIEKYNRDTLTTQPDQWRYIFGLLAFPAPRLEMRLDFANGRSVGEANVDADSWLIQGQIHVSL